jgi:hypothetical protein
VLIADVVDSTAPPPPPADVIGPKVDEFPDLQDAGTAAGLAATEPPPPTVTVIPFVIDTQVAVL